VIVICSMEYKTKGMISLVLFGCLVLSYFVGSLNVLERIGINLVGFIIFIVLFLSFSVYYFSLAYPNKRWKMVLYVNLILFAAIIIFSVMASFFPNGSDFIPPVWFALGISIICVLIPALVVSILVASFYIWIERNKFFVFIVLFILLVFSYLLDFFV